METLFAFLSLASFVLLVLGLIKPSLVFPKNWKASRGKAVLIYLGLFILFALIGANLSSDSLSKENQASIEETSSKSQDNTVSSDTTISAVEENEVESSIGKEIEVGYFIYKVTNVRFKKTIGDDIYSETADGVYMLVDLTIKNISNETRILDGSDFFLTGVDDIKYEYSTNGSTALEFTGGKTIFLKQCQPNITTKGTLIFEVPEQGSYYIHLVDKIFGDKTVKILLK